ncbi:MAG TPA: hypothetical protein VMJ10_21405 [Kofleriaceae bacterium]|nr:hypothetical protein [Kofleriaceae bacterium]
MGVAAAGHATPKPRCIVAGTWTGSGDDVAGTHWTFVLELAEHDGVVTGTFHWKTKAGAGDEHVRGRLDCEKATLVMSGSSVSGGLATADYHLTLGGDSKTMRGPWTCQSQVPCIEGQLAGTRR